MHTSGDWEGKQCESLDPVERPVVRAHPETGRTALFVNPGFTSHIKGLSRVVGDVQGRHRVIQRVTRRGDRPM